VPADFDPELHLRLTGERALLDTRQGQSRDVWNTPLLESAAALVAVGALDEERAQSIVDDYYLALGLRGRGDGGFRRFRHLPRQNRQPLKASRVVLCEQRLAESWGELRVHYVALGDRETTVGITASSPPHGLLGMGPRGLLHQPFLTDDRGHSVSAQFSGGGSSDGSFRGRLTTVQPLARDTRWLDIGSSRVDLVGGSEPPLVEIETLPDRDPAVRYLWGRMSSGRHGPHGGGRRMSIDDGIETLVAAGALTYDDPAIGEIRDVLAAFSGQQPLGVVPHPWAELLAGLGRQGGPSGIVGLGVVTPPFDDTVVSLETLMVTDGNFEVHLAMSPNSAAVRGPMSISITGPAIEWWADDDVGNCYLGAIGNWGGGGDIGEGTVTYWPALDPRASRLRILPTGSHKRAAITVDLPRWDEQS
jgi:hypothetical protein